MNKKSLGIAMKVARGELGLNQEQMAEKFGVAQQTLGDWERTGKIPAGRKWQIKEFYGIDIEQASVSAKNHSHASGGYMEITNSQAPAQALSVEEQYLINLLREKDATKSHLRRYIAELLAL